METDFRALSPSPSQYATGQVSGTFLARAQFYVSSLADRSSDLTDGFTELAGRHITHPGKVRIR